MSHGKKRIGFILPDKSPTKMQKLEEDNSLLANFGLLKQKHVYQKEITLPAELLGDDSISIGTCEKLDATKEISEDQSNVNSFEQEAAFAQDILREQDVNFSGSR